MTSANILIVDDEPANVRLLERLLQGAGYTRLEKTTDSRQVLTLFQTFHPDLILLDLLMPHLRPARPRRLTTSRRPATVGLLLWQRTGPARWEAPA